MLFRLAVSAFMLVALASRSAHSEPFADWPPITDTDCQVLRHPVKALAACKVLVSRFGDWATPHAIAAGIDWYLRDNEAAFAEAQAALALAPSEPLALVTLAEVTNDRGDRQGLKRIVARLMGLPGQTFDELMARGLGFYFDRDHDKAFADFDRATVLMPSNPFPYAARARLHRERHEKAQAIADLDAAIEKGEGSAFAYVFRAQALEVDDSARAFTDCTKAIDLDADFPLAYVLRGRLFEIQKNYSAALADFDHALRLVPNFPPAHAGRGRIFAATGDNAAGFQELNLAIALDPFARSPLLDRAEIELRLKQFDEAKKDLQRAETNNPAHALRLPTDRLARDRELLALLTAPPQISPAGQTSTPPAADIAENLPPQMLEPAKISLLGDIAACSRAVEVAQTPSKIAACTRVIGTPKVASVDLVNALTARAAAYHTESKNFYWAGDKAAGADAINNSLEDYNTVLKLDPGNSAAIQGRYDATRTKETPPKQLSADNSNWKPPTPEPALIGVPSVEAVRVLLAEKRFDDAIAEATSVIGSTSSTPSAYGVRGEAYLQKSEFEKSADDFGRAFELEPSNSEWKQGLSRALLGRGLHLMRQAQLDGAMADFDWIIKITPSTLLAAGAYVGKCGIENLKRNFTAAKDACDASIKIAPKLSGAYMERAATYIGLKATDAAMNDLTYAIELEPHNDVIFAARARLFISQASFDKAESDIKYALQINPRSAQANALQGSIYLLFRAPKQALACFALALETDPHEVVALSGRGWATALLGDFDRGLTDIDAAIKLDPTRAIAFAWHGSLLLLKGDRDKASADFQKALTLDQNKAWIFATRGEAYLRLKDWTLAKQDFDAAIGADPKYEIAYIDRAIYWESRRRYDNAVADLSKVNELNPKNALVYAERAHIQRMNGNFSAADDLEAKAIAIDPRVRDIIRAFDRKLEAIPEHSP